MENKKEPLAERMRPENLNDFFGQEHVVGKNTLLYQSIISKNIGSCIFYGPPGTGKTTLAHIIAKTLNGCFEKLNAVTSGVADAKNIIDKAKRDKAFLGVKTYLLLDECHRWNKSQSDCVLEAVEKGDIVFIGSTTENPFTSMTRAIVSRCQIYEFKPLSNNDIIKVVDAAVEKEFAHLKIKMTNSSKKLLADLSSGDVRKALNVLELVVSSTPFNKEKTIEIKDELISKSFGSKTLSTNIDDYYDILSAFCKSIRGSDTEGALYYSARLIKSGVDPKIIARRLIAHCSEDVGMADSNALLLSMTALQCLEKLGVPEGLLNLNHAIIYACEAEKSNSVYLAMQKANFDVEKFGNLPVPNHLKNHKSINKDGHGEYVYPHNFGGYVKQQYLPDKIKNNVYYTPSKNGKEKNLKRKKGV